MYSSHNFLFALTFIVFIVCDLRLPYLISIYHLLQFTSVQGGPQDLAGGGGARIFFSD